MKPRNKKLVYGVGINDADYAVKKHGIVEVNGVRKRRIVWRCPYYEKWRAMFERCYSAKFQERQPTYKGCSVSEEWHTFSVFKSWMKDQDWEGLQLDKDLLVKGNKVYGPDTCMFVTGAVNSFVNDNVAQRGEWLVGVDLHKQTGKFRTRCKNPFTKKEDHLGLFTCEQEAHEAWRKRKLELAHELAAIQTDSRVAKALIKRYSKPIREVPLQ